MNNLRERANYSQFSEIWRELLLSCPLSLNNVIKSISSLIALIKRDCWGFDGEKSLLDKLASSLLFTLHSQTEGLKPAQKKLKKL